MFVQFGYEQTCTRAMILSGLVLLALSVSVAGSELDKSRYITLDEIRTDMDAYCLTVFTGSKIEKFPLKILSIVRDFEPKRDAILVVGTDERFIHAGTVHGCSGSPVYIDGRLAGALAAGWDGSKDPLYLVTPIEDMLRIGTGVRAKKAAGTASQGIDFSQPLAFSDVSRQFHAIQQACNLPVVTSLPPSVCSQLAQQFEKMGMTLIAAGNAGGAAESAETVEYKPGGVLSIPLISGDISMAPTGTITEVIGNKVYAFGHNFSGIGPTDLPMAGGIVHTVVPGRMYASKLTTPGAVKGAIRFDEATGVYGQIDAEARTIGLRISVDRYDDPERRIYNCRLAVDRLRTPLMLQTAIIAAISMHGSLPPEHTLRYKGRADIAGYGQIAFENISSGQQYTEIASEALSIAALLLTNPYEKIEINDLDFDIRITPDNRRTVIRTVNIADSSVKPGETITASVLLQSHLSQLSLKRIDITVPPDLAPGNYEITIAGGYDYEKFVRKVASYKFTAYDAPTLVGTLGYLLSIRRDRLYIAMALPSSGVVIKRAELPHLPATKALLLSDEKRTIPTQKYGRWIENSMDVGLVVVGSQRIKITVEK